MLGRNSIEPNKLSEQRGFSLFEVLIAAGILAVAVAGVMRLHTRNVQETAGNAQLQRAYWVVSNAYQRFQMNHSLSTSDVKELEQQAATVGLNSVQIINDGSVVGLKWLAWDTQSRVQRGCVADQAFSCIQVNIK
ncbi:MAG: prepilin-type N-terminal cleavage/methylation domain-containing protein [Burkholderiaceae bacterium]